MKIIKYFLKWFLIFLGVCIFTFLIVRAMPVSPIEMLLQKYNLPITIENQNLLIKQYGLDKSIFEQFTKWFFNILKGDFGFSFITKLDIKAELLKRLPVSIVIGLGSLLISIFLAYLLGFLSVIKENSIFDKISRLISIISLSLPNFILAIIVIYFLGVKFRFFRFFTTDKNFAILFCTLIMVFYQIGPLSRIVVSSFNEVKKETFVEFYLLRGFSLPYVLFFHAYKPVLYSLLSASVSRFSSVIGGSGVLEFAFTINGVSYYLISSIVARDYNIIQAYIILIFVWMFVVHLIFDIILLFLKERKKV